MSRRAFILAASLPLLSACTPNLDRDRYRIEELDARTREISSLDATSAMRAIPEPDPTDRPAAKDRSDHLIAMMRAGTPRDLTLVEVREVTLRNNLGIQAAVISPQVAAQILRAEQAKFESTFTASVIDQRTVNPAYYGGPLINTTSDVLTIVPGLNVPLQTGGSVSLDWSLSTQLYSTTDDAVGDQSFAYSQPTISIEQPLLRGAGIEFNQASIVLAEAQVGRERAAAQLDVINQLVQAEVAYWSVYLARREFDIALETYEISRRLLDDQRQMVRLGSGSIANVYNFEVALSSAFDQVLAAEQRLRLSVRGLKVVMQQPDLTLDGSATLRPTTEPRLIGFDVEPKVLVDHALANRADLLQFEYQQIQRTIDVLMRDQDVLPEVDVFAAWTFNGFDFAGRSLVEATQDLGDGNISGWAVGLNASVPIGNEVRLASYQAAVLRRLKSIADVRQRRITVTGEVLDAIDTLQIQWDRILTARYQVEAARRFFEAYGTLFDRGQIPSANLTDALRSLNASLINRARVETEYQVALAKLAQSVGCLLGHAGVEWSDVSDLDRLQAPAGDPTVGITDRFVSPSREYAGDPDAEVPAPSAPADVPAGAPSGG